MPHQILQKCLEIKKVKKLRRLVHHKLNNFQSKMNMTMHKQKNSKNKETQTLLSFIKKFNKCRYWKKYWYSINLSTIKTKK